jgi:Chromate transporter
LALDQLTPGPILMLAAFIGYKLFGVLGAVVAAGAIFLPSFVMVPSILPLLRRMKDLLWLKAFTQGVAPAVIGALGVSVMQMAPHAPPISLLGACRRHHHVCSVLQAWPVALDGGRRGAWISVLAQNMDFVRCVSGIDRTAEVDRRLKQAAPLRGVNRSSCRASSLATAAGPRRVPRSPKAPVRKHRADIDLAKYTGLFAGSCAQPIQKVRVPNDRQRLAVDIEQLHHLRRSIPIPSLS